MSNPDIREVTQVVRERIGVSRERGLDHAFRVVGARLGITPRRARSYWLRQVTTMSVAEWRTVMEAAAEWVAKDTRRLEAQNAVLRERLAAGAGRASSMPGCGSGSSWDGVERRGRGVPPGMTLALAMRSVGG